MSLELSPSMLHRLLQQKEIARELQKALAQEFVRGGEGWQLLDLVGEKQPLPESRDPVLLALRRLAWPELEDLHARHRVAVLEAPARIHGFLQVVLEEAAAIEYPEGLPEVQHDEALKTFFALTSEKGKKRAGKEMANLRSRGLLYVTRRLLALGDDFAELFLRLTYRRIGERSKDLELSLFLRETMAMVLEGKAKIEEGVHLILETVVKLAENKEALEKMADRCAEGLVEAAETLSRHQLSPADIETYYGMAETFLKIVPPNLNRGLRRRLAARTRRG